MSVPSMMLPSRRSADFAEKQSADIHEVRITRLEPETQYFYRVESTDESGQRVVSDLSTFSTAVLPGAPFAYVVISDTQGNPTVSSQLFRHAWAQHFFPGMQELISRVPMYPVLGNHEQNASNYFEYMSLPEPEYYYDFRYGDASFFMVDSNRNVGQGSEQHPWLDERLAYCGGGAPQTYAVSGCTRIGKRQPLPRSATPGSARA